MKRLMAIGLAALLLLGGCAPAAAPIQYDPVPQKVQEITLGGHALSGIYSDGKRLYLKSDE